MKEDDTLRHNHNTQEKKKIKKISKNFSCAKIRLKSYAFLHKCVLLLAFSPLHVPSTRHGVKAPISALNLPILLKQVMTH